MRIPRRGVLALAGACLTSGCVQSVLQSESGGDDHDHYVQLRNEHSESHQLRVELPLESADTPVLMMNARLEAGDETDRRSVGLDGVGDEPELHTELDGGPRDTHDVSPGFYELIVSVGEDGALSVETTDK